MTEKTKTDCLTALAKRHGLALLCIIGPIVLGLLAPHQVALFLIPPAYTDAIKIEYRPAEKPPLTQSVAPSRPKSSEAAPKPPEAAPPSKEKLELAAKDNSAWLHATQIYGRAKYVSASAFLYVAAAAGLVFAIAVLFRELGWRGLLFSVVVFSVFSFFVAYSMKRPNGRPLLLDRLLNAADEFDAVRIPGASGDAIGSLVTFNIFVSLIPIGMILMALYALSIREKSVTDLNQTKLARRFLELQIAAGIASALLVIGVLASKALLEWPMSIVATDQASALKPIADTIILLFGTIGTITLVTALAPAIIAWMRDTEWLASQSNEENLPDQLSTAAKPVFKVIPLITGILTVLAPLLTSPVVEALKSLLEKFGS